MTREEIKKAMRDTKREIVIKNLHKLLSLVEGYPEYQDCIGYAIEKLEQDPTIKNDLAVNCISRPAAIDAIKRIHPIDTDYNCTLLDKVDVMYVLNNLPSVTPQERKGHWIKIKPYPLQMHDYECSKCGHETDDNTENYCSDCGAKMVEPQESEE